MKRWHINVFTSCDDQFPVNTYVTDSSETAAGCVARLLANPLAGFSRVEVLDSTKTLPLLVMAPQNLD